MKIKESEAMTEIRKIRTDLSRKMKNMTPDEQVEFVKKGAGKLEKEFGLKLPKVKKETAGVK